MRIGFYVTEEHGFGCGNLAVARAIGQIFRGPISVPYGDRMCALIGMTYADLLCRDKKSWDMGIDRRTDFEITVPSEITICLNPIERNNHFNRYEMAARRLGLRWCLPEWTDKVLEDGGIATLGNRIAVSMHEHKMFCRTKFTEFLKCLS